MIMLRVSSEMLATSETDTSDLLACKLSQCYEKKESQRKSWHVHTLAELLPLLHQQQQHRQLNMMEMLSTMTLWRNRKGSDGDGEVCEINKR